MRVVIKKKFRLHVNFGGQVKADEARLALPQFSVRVGEGVWGILAVSWGDTY